MDRQLKQRVVGAAVLVALGVIFIPLFLDNSDFDAPRPNVQQIPPPPEDDFLSRVVPLDEAEIEAMDERTELVLPPIVGTEPESEPEAKSGSALQSEPVVVSEPHSRPAEKPDKSVVKAPAPAVAPPKVTAPASSAAPAPVAALTPPRESVDAWTVQLGSFSNDENARRLIDKLRKAGFPAYLERRVDTDTTAFKVRVGPQIQREEAQQVRDQLAEQFSLKGILLRYR